MTFQEDKYQKFEVLDGNYAAAEVAYSMSDMCFIYPITPSSSMGEKADDLSAERKKNIFGDVVTITQMQSEGGVSGAFHGALLSGALCSTFTCSQGLLLMIPELYKITGEHLPAVFHVASRVVGGQAMSIGCDYGDVFATRATGIALLSSHSVQQVADLATIAHVATVRAQLPILHFFDGFRVSHEMQKILMPTNALLEAMIDKEAIRRFRREKTMKTTDPTMRGLVQNSDIYFQVLESGNTRYNNMVTIMKQTMEQFAALTGRKYAPFVYHGPADATHIVVTMGTACKSFEEYLTLCPESGVPGVKFGLVAVHLFHPFSVEDFVAAIPATATHITIIDRAKEPGAVGEPLYLECIAALVQTGMLGGAGACAGAGRASIQWTAAGRAGVGGKDITPAVCRAVLANMAGVAPDVLGAGTGAGAETVVAKRKFTVGIEDDVTFLSLPMPRAKVSLSVPGVRQALFYGFGADGTVGAIKNAIQIIGDNTTFYSQAFFVFDAKKSGGVTISHIRFGPAPITSQYEINDADYLACHHPSYLAKYPMLDNARKGGVFVVNGPWTDAASLGAALPAASRRAIAEKGLAVYVIDAEKIASQAGLKGRINMVMQTVFFYLSGVLPIEQAIALQKDAIRKTYIKKGEQVVAQNWACVDAAIAGLVKITVPADEWSGTAAAADGNLTGKAPTAPAPSTFFNDVCQPVLALKGGQLPVSAIAALSGGAWPTCTSKFERRNVSSDVPVWNAAACVQCNLCSFGCPHSAIRPFLVTASEAAKGGVGKTAALKGPALKIDVGAGEESLQFALGISSEDCIGCTCCVGVCPVKALTMAPNHTPEMQAEQCAFDYLMTLPDRSPLVLPPTQIVSATAPPSFKNVSFRQPLLEYNAACGGCAEAPLIRTITQMFGERLVVAVSCGCTMVWAGYAPTSPFTVSREGFGPAYTGSLFEDTAEFAYGIAAGGQVMREQLLHTIEQAVGRMRGMSCAGATPEESAARTAMKEQLVQACEAWQGAYDDPEKSKTTGVALVATIERALPHCDCDDMSAVLAEIRERREFLQKKSYWCVGGDGWAYDIGFGGLDQVLQMGAKLNILVMDNEVYSNTGGQKSKATPRGAIARFAAAGKETRKKDLGMYAMGLGCVYVASVALGANPQQLVRALCEAEAFPGTSLVIALCPCINWGMQGGQAKSVAEQKRAVQCGYWNLYRYNPLLRAQGKNPLTLDSPAPTGSLAEFLKGETRFAALMMKDKATADRLHAELQQDITERYERLVAMAK